MIGVITSFQNRKLSWFRAQYDDILAQKHSLSVRLMQTWWTLKKKSCMWLHVFC